jgi:DNA-binding response OmpR family regulator
MTTEKKKARPAYNGKLEGLAAAVSRPDTHKNKLITILVKNYRKAVPTDRLISAIYGAKKVDDNRGAFGMCVGGLRATLADRKTPYVIEHSEDGYGLFPKVRS